MHIKRKLPVPTLCALPCADFSTMKSPYPTLPYPEVKLCRLVCSAPLHWSWNRAPPELSAQLLVKLLSKKVERSHCLTHTPPPFCASLPRNTLDITVTFTAEFRFSAPPGTPHRPFHVKPKIVTASQHTGHPHITAGSCPVWSEADSLDVPMCCRSGVQVKGNVIY